MTIASNAKDVSSEGGLAVANAEAVPSNLMDALNQPKKTSGAAKKQVDKTVTASTRVPKQSNKQGGRPYHSIISRYATEYGVPVSLAHAVISVESNYRPGVRGRAGEIGLMQIKPATARMMGYSGSAKGLYEPETNIKYGMKYLAEAFKLGGGKTCSVILKYNAGHGAKRMNPVSSAYCQKVKRLIGGK
ncbi:lytic transglycosylase domain-containing protein [Chelativorans sp. J32]|uniref:lytic transglycosylase domain-containing protein n=1 Tax=Chelativorans sp. J32 TaxID=935840 RepID=UPI00352998F9